MSSLLYLKDVQVQNILLKYVLASSVQFAKLEGCKIVYPWSSTVHGEISSGWVSFNIKLLNNI